MNNKKAKCQLIIVGAFVLCLMSAIPAQAQSGGATKADIKRLDHEVEMLKSQVTQIQATMNQHSKGQPPAGTGPQGQGMGSQQKGMPMMDDDKMEMPPMGNAQQPQGGNMPSGGMGDM